MQEWFFTVLYISIMHPYAHTHIAHSGVFFGAYSRTAVHPMCCCDHPVLFCSRLAGGISGALSVFDGSQVPRQLAVAFLAKNDQKKRHLLSPPNSGLSYK